MVIDYPPVFINTYLSEKISESLPDYFDGSVRFFPTQPSTIDALTEQSPEDSEEPFAVYDRMFRMRRKAFPHIRTEQLLYYFYKTAGGIEALIETTQAVQDILDNGSDSTEDLNYWIKEKYSAESKTELVLPSEIKTRLDRYTSGMSATEKEDFVIENSKETAVVSFGEQEFFLPYFYEMKIFHLEESRDIIDFGTARTYAANKIILEYMWHKP